MTETNTSLTANIAFRWIVTCADVLIALLFFFGGLNLALGVHSGHSLINRFLGVGVLAFVVGLLLTLYAIAIKSRWKLVLRSVLYGILLAVVSAALIEAAHSQAALLNSREQAVFALFWFVALGNVALGIQVMRQKGW